MNFFKHIMNYFLRIPKTGDTNSHQYLIEPIISAYVGDEYVNPLITELQAEITSLKTTNPSNSNETINDFNITIINIR
jgi:hypothetical protein